MNPLDDIANIPEPFVLDTSRPHPARVYNYLLGGGDNYAADRAAVIELLKLFPDAEIGARANRAFMRRAIRYLASTGVRQFLDIGTGIPTEPNLHQEAQKIHRDARVVYVDNDPVVLAHARALLHGTHDGRTAYIHADAADPEAILSSPVLAATLDMTQPIAISLIALMHFIGDDADPYGIVATLLDAVVPGSYLVMSHVSGDFGKDARAGIKKYQETGMSFTARTHDEFRRFFTGLDIIDPGIVALQRCRPGEALFPSDPKVALLAPNDRSAHIDPARIPLYAGIARKPATTAIQLRSDTTRGDLQ